MVIRSDRVRCALIGVAGVEVAAVFPQALLEALRPPLLRRPLGHIAGALRLLQAGSEAHIRCCRHVRAVTCNLSWPRTGA